MAKKTTNHKSIFIEEDDEEVDVKDSVHVNDIMDFDTPQLSLAGLEEEDVNEDEEIDTKPPSTLLTIPCLLCTQGYQPLTGQLDFDKALSDQIFDRVCKTLKVKVTKKNSWDFGKDMLPFCSSCLGLSEELLDIEQKIRDLEQELQFKTEQLLQLVQESNNQNANEKYRSDRRYRSFRNQILKKGPLTPKIDVDTIKPICRRTRAKRRNSKIYNKEKVMAVTVTSVDTPLPLLTKYRKSSNLITNALSEDDGEGSESLNQDEPTRNTRRSTRWKQITESESEDFISPINDTHFSSNESGDGASISENDNDIGLILPPITLEPALVELLFKQEIDMEDENENNTDKDLRDENDKITARPKRLLEKRNKRKPNLAVSDDNSSDSDFIPGDNDDAVSDKEDLEYNEEGTHEYNIYRKWTYDKSTGQMWYDGVEVIQLSNGLKCSKCDMMVEGKKWNHKYKIKHHIIGKHLVSFACVLCDKVLSARKYLDMHVRMVHEKSINIPCDVCEKPFTSINAMRRHKWNHQNEEEKQAAVSAGKKPYGAKQMELLQCGQCGKMCKGPYNLRRHEETHMEAKDRPKHMCQICGGLYSAPETLRSHIKLAHDNNNRLQWLQCPECPKKFPQPGRLEKHMRSHTGEKPFICSECGAAFSQPTLLKVHSLKHKNLRPHQCEHCEMRFYRRYHLQRHTQVYHESLKPPTKKQPYRSAIGTRKPPQKRERKKATLQQPIVNQEQRQREQVQEQLQYENNLIQEHTNARHQSNSQTTSCDNVDPQQLIGMVGNLHNNDAQNFETIGNNCNYPFTTYTFSHQHGLHHQ